MLDERALLKRFEPVLRYTRGEQFFPIDVQRYMNKCSLWRQRPGERPMRLVPEGELTLEKLAEPRGGGFGAVHYLKFIDPLNLAELAEYRLRRDLIHRDPEERFQAGRGRLARVGYASRFVDAIFTLSLLARGRVPGDTAAAAALTYQRMMEKEEGYYYCGRVLQQDEWVVLQYWFFYPYNNWRSSFNGANDHEGDWEMVCLYLYEDDEGELTPEWAAYANHDYSGDDLRRRWDDPELEKVGEHPVVYAGAGSHASYFSPGEYVTELELSFLSPVLRFYDYWQRVWRRWLRRIPEENSEAPEEQPRNLFRIPFVDYARGDGHVIGPGQERNWGEPRLLGAEQDWVGRYRGLWGLYAQDPVSGENAPAGPMYNRDGAVRPSWYDPVGFAGLDKVEPPNKSLPQARLRRQELEERRQALTETIRDKTAELRFQNMESRAMHGQAHQRKRYAEHLEQAQALSEEIHGLRAQLASDEALLDSLELYIERHAQGFRTPARAHLHKPMHPTSSQALRVGRFAETWSALSIGLMLLSFVSVFLFAREYLVLSLAVLISLGVFIEAGLRRQLSHLANGITILLAVVAGGILLVEFFWEILVGVVVLSCAYIIWENLKELWS